jgi:hypothetical protein
MAEILIAAVPLFLLLGALFLGHYPGHEAVVRLSERIAVSRSLSAPSAARRQRRPIAPRSFAASGGLLIAFGIASRPPPLAPAQN